MRLLKRWLHEPLVHFLLLGLALFLLDAWLRPASAPSPSSVIVVDEARIRNLAQNFQRTWQRPPTKTEIEGLVETHVREEVMVREALALGLDRDDAIIRRRLQQKLEFVSEGAAARAEPTDEALLAYMTAHPDAFAVDARYTFRQVFLDPGGAGPRWTRTPSALRSASGPGTHPTRRRRATSCRCSNRATRTSPPARWRDCSDASLPTRWRSSRSGDGAGRYVQATAHTW